MEPIRKPVGMFVVVVVACVELFTLIFPNIVLIVKHKLLSRVVKHAHLLKWGGMMLEDGRIATSLPSSEPSATEANWRSFPAAVT